ncbi:MULTISPECIES: tetratricopeptide repeat protein [unclassified Oleiphilus]|jgi:tetratricopeptide (TPR) repeat protein|uniref:tetratricopeptide repeat protein n=3 Tax=Oleiphilus TaxID=141450 RepID=UPI0007C3D8A3|nr:MULTISPECIES: tetratricopeptide repeat protein [unclassified Oleiphilus]KZY40158.1 hypothetical protein A3732_20470 [Oleiphilus sp. HI0050]KZY73600.1 hypothetical protein A3740_18640 [Oleiphilus sp. HI0068]KZY79537.1 hypothetical protein A3741_06775 [Oleiphilus sp. HI0069]KZY96580.1 hypothetical protein A3743_04495 [Oleiphilus sp. HI0072]KZZ29258.1 hypothetical protein A3752_03320 [Oleiphilus sp. HI0081]KZZ32416.1 hypothetical protein A3755_09825 [Oleiphilus sp. HI0085]
MLMNISKPMSHISKVILVIGALYFVVACSSTSKKIEPIQIEKPASAIVKPILTEDDKIAYKQGLALIKEKSYVEAEEIFKGLIDRYPTLAGAYVNLGLIRHSNRQLAEAEGYYQQALDINPKNVNALIQLSLISQDEGKFQDSERFLKSALAKDSNHPMVNYNLGVLYELYLRDYDQAIEHYQAYVKNAGEDDTKTVERWIKMLERK